MTFESDLELWSRSVRGDGEAFAILFDRHERRVYRAVFRAAEDTGAAEDLVATVFLELWRRRDQVRMVDQSIAPWLLVTAANVTRNANRSLRRHRALLAKLPMPDRQTFDDTAAEHDLIATLRALPRRDAEILALIAVDELPVSQAAAALGITEQTARARLSRARRRLRSHLPATLHPESEGSPS